MASGLSQLSKAWKIAISSKPLLIIVAGLLIFTLIESQNFILPSVISSIQIPIQLGQTMFQPAVLDSSNTTETNSTTPVSQAKKIWTLSDMDDLLSKNRASPQIQIPHWPSKVDQQMLYARKEVENAPSILKDEQQFYKPIYRNLSTFKRSYELMEKILKVYVYKEGKKPVFHEPFYGGLYASEGWFMKQMEESAEFRVDDPSMAHLFYLPFSSKNLRKTYCPPGTHSKRIMIRHLDNFTELVSTKYPYWNRTDGTDHFLTGCHDWAHKVTEKSSMHIAIRALCTSDMNLGFEIGKDVPLPATKIRYSAHPQFNIGGKPAEERTTLAFFAGHIGGKSVRLSLVEYWENKDPKMVITGALPPLMKVINSSTNKPMMLNSYVHYMKSSKFCISPRGFEVWSPRLMEAIFYGCVPVILSDNFVPPLFEVLNWSEFSVILPEKDVPKLRQALMDIPHWRYLELERGVREVRRHFVWNTNPVKYDIFHMILHSVWLNRLYQISTQ